jgi:N-acetylglucosaminyldiphosphoundecaprenol N-acetyl-beta-D-mannosaminyltransferase
MSSNELILRDRVRVVSLEPDVVDHDLAVARVAQLVRDGGGYVCFATVHMVMEAHDSPEFAAKVNGADLIVTDGMPIVWMQQRQGKTRASRVRANDLMMSLCEYAANNGLSVGFYGGKPEVIDAILERARRDFPSLTIAYAYSPPFRTLTPEEDAEVVDKINAASPDLLFMGLGCPKQERWMAEHRDRLRAVMLGVGASFDFFAGNVKESPEWLGRLGLEWLFRLTQEPRRLWRRYLILNPRFMWLAFRQLISQRR